MNRIKKTFLPLLAAACLLVSGCERVVDEPRGITLRASFYPIYVLLQNVCEDVPDLTVRCLTQPQDGCPRDYALSDWDAALLPDTDALALGGRGLESFESALEGGGAPVFTLMGSLSLIGQGETVPEGDDEAGHFTGARPWAWLSASGAREMCRAACAAMIALDPGYAARYEENLEKATTKFSNLETYTASRMKDAPKETVALFHEGLCYLARDLGLSYVEIEREPGAEMDEAGLSAALEKLRGAGATLALLEEQAPDSLRRAISAAGVRAVFIDTLTAHTETDPDTYFTVMRQNVDRVAAALTTP